jgi:branched-chain amino acid transport system substrate-binding protein
MRGIRVLCLLLAVLGGACSNGAREVRIGVLLPLTGAEAPYGDSVKKGLVLALAEEAQRKDAASARLRLVYRDSAAGDAEAVRAMRELLAEHRTPAVLAVSSETALACARLANETRTLLLTPTGTAPEISDGGQWVYRTAATEVLDAVTMAQYCVQSSLEPVVVLASRGRYGQSLARLFRQSLHERGGTVLEVLDVEAGARGLLPELQRLAAKKPRAVYVAAAYPEAAVLLRHAREAMPAAQLMGPAALHLHGFLASGAAPAEGLLLTQPAYDPALDEEPLRSFVRTFRARYGQTPDLYSAAGYDAGRILLAAVRVGGGDALAVKRAFDALEGFEGVIGETTFDRNGDVTRIPQISALRDGALVRVR